MKKIIKSAFQITLFASVLSITSCQQNDLLPQQSAPEASARIAAGELISTIPTIYRLTRQNAKVLTYDAKGRVSTSTDDEGASTFTYGYNLITRKRNDNTEKTDYFLDGSGRCIKSITSFPTVASNLPKMIIYEYNNQGKLSQTYELGAPTAKTNYAYNRLGDLTSITYHNADGTVASVNSYFYQMRSEELLSNTYALNPDNNGYLDADLAIFGKFYDHFYKRMVEENKLNGPTLALWNDVTYSYTLNSDGVPTKRVVKTAHPGYADWTFDINYTYQATKLNIGSAAK